MEEKGRILATGWVRFFLLALALLNLVVSYVIHAEHPVLAGINAMMALVLVVVLGLSWRGFQ